MKTMENFKQSEQFGERYTEETITGGCIQEPRFLDIRYGNIMDCNNSPYNSRNICNQNQSP